jgi:hypothetical protein
VTPFAAGCCVPTDAPELAGLSALADRIDLWPIHRLRRYERNPSTQYRIATIIRL